ncbi:THO complex subunit 6 homolog [Oppia nitens]|uniref:THO complex subunit 6 homolog n=1 Tax=Oppia nitens TaxID=1686743 RepID=UPI0023DA7EE9|nr:THO complex subunit 6 homolog [Oppia nitens]
MKDNNNISTKDTETERTITMSDKRDIFYTTILSHVMSADGRHLACGLKRGKLAVFDIQSIVKQNHELDAKAEDDENLVDVKPLRRPQHLVDIETPVYSVTTIGHNSQFVVGGKGQLQGWVREDNELTNEWTIHLPANDCMANTVATTDDMIYTGCGDNNVYGFDVETHKQIHRLCEHNGYINCILLAKDGQRLYSGAEDGSVRIWDLRCPRKSVSTFEPYKYSDLQRQKYGNWIGTVELVSNDWLLCGGGPHLSLWHLNMLSYSTRFVTDSSTNVAVVHNDYIITGGNTTGLNIWEINGELKSVLPTATDNVFSIATHQYKQSADTGIDQVISAAGMSYKVDVCTNWKYKDFELVVY